MNTFYQELYSAAEQGIDKESLTRKKLELAKKHKLAAVPTDSDLLLEAPEELAGVFVSKPMRTQSGVAPIALMTKPFNCPHGKCTFCPGGIGSPFGDVPQSYTGHEPSTLRGIRNHYDSYLEVFNRLEQYTVMGHSPQKAELIIMGGTFPAMPPEYQEEFVWGAFKALNDFQEIVSSKEKFREFFELPGEIGNPERISRIQAKLLQLKGKSTLEEEHFRNEAGAIRCVGLTIETKPDWAKLEHANNMLALGCTRVELGIESVYDDVLKHTHRGHTMQDTYEAMQVLKDLGFKINAHYMPGMPLTDRERDLAGMKQLFSDEGLKPDMLKVYPCMVSPGTALEREFKAGRFTPLTTNEAGQLIAEWKPFVPEYCRIMRVQRDVPTKWWTAGVDITNLRQYVFEKYNAKCRCIRCREPKGKKPDWEKVEVKVEKYYSSGGREFFISAEDTAQDMILGFCRLRFPGQFLRPEITQATALIRELHVYGKAEPLGAEGRVQHHGLGQQLLAKAEEIAKKSGKDKMVVISGVGARQYYFRTGYAREGPYVSKKLCQ